MADYGSSLPIRTETNGDAAVKVVDGTITSQAMAVDSAGKVTAKINDGAGNSLASSTVNPTGTEQAIIVRPIPNTNPTPSSQSGNWSTRTQDGAGNPITSSAAGATRPFDVAIRDGAGALYGTPANPFNVAMSYDFTGTEINNFQTNAAVAAAATSNHDYTVTTGKTLLLKQIEATSSGKSKIEVQIETGAATGIFNTRVVQFNSTATPNMSIHFDDPAQVPAGAKVRVIRTNLDKASTDLYSTVMGQEI